MFPGQSRSDSVTESTSNADAESGAIATACFAKRQARSTSPKARQVAARRSERSAEDADFWVNLRMTPSVVGISPPCTATRARLTSASSSAVRSSLLGNGRTSVDAATCAGFAAGSALQPLSEMSPANIKMPPITMWLGVHCVNGCVIWLLSAGCKTTRPRSIHVRCPGSLQ